MYITFFSTVVLLFSIVVFIISVIVLRRARRQLREMSPSLTQKQIDIDPTTAPHSLP